MTENEGYREEFVNKTVFDSRSPILASSSSQDPIGPHANLLAQPISNKANVGVLIKERSYEDGASPGLAPSALEGNRERRRVPFLHRPLEGDENVWLHKEHEAEEWLSLLYEIGRTIDLAVVAVLTIFSNNHELNKPSAIPIFLSYYAIISWVWTSQIRYDIRYQAQDGWHRIAKAVQIMTFVYMGAASGNWNPGLIMDEESFLAEMSSMDASTHRSANESFMTVLSAFAISRAFLALQNLVCAWNAYRVGRKLTFHVLPFGSLVASCVLTVVAIVIPASGRPATVVKIATFYFSICLEMITVWVAAAKSWRHKIRTQSIGVRYGAFTLIIIGEGFISVTRASNLAISGFSITNTMTYAQVFLAISIMYLLFAFLFGKSDCCGDVRESKVLLWEALHFPMHFNLLLLLAAMVNAIVVLSFARGVSSVASHYISTIESIVNGTDLSHRDQRYVARYFDHYTVEMALLRNLSMAESPPDDPTIVAYQYLGQIMFQVTNSYGIELEDSMLRSLEDLYALNTTWSSNDTLQSTRQDEAFSLLRQILQEPTSTSLSGVLWLFPTAGLALIFSALRSISWTRHKKFVSGNWIKNAIYILCGSFLALLGFLDIGSKDFDAFADTVENELRGVNPMYWLVHTRTPLVIVLAMYLLAYFGELITSTCIRRLRRGKPMDQGQMVEA
ncbi:hypothetical protein I317_04441 [Kwoniella heveanensis CBS 569]|nr:hypothetical protein I317_04441 [Kwoniella heveanensis CBS 569]